VPWRFSDAGKHRAHLKRRDAASEKPAQIVIFLVWNWFGLVSPPYPGLETIRYQTLPMRSQISGYRAKAALP